MKKKIIAYVVSAVMVLTMVPATAFAATGTDTSAPKQTAPDALTAAQGAAIDQMYKAFEADSVDYDSTNASRYAGLIDEYMTKINAATTTGEVSAALADFAGKVANLSTAEQIIDDYADAKKAVYTTLSTEIDAAATAGKALCGDSIAANDEAIADTKAAIDKVVSDVDANLKKAQDEAIEGLNEWIDVEVYDGAKYDADVTKAINQIIKGATTDIKLASTATAIQTIVTNATTGTGYGTTTYANLEEVRDTAKTTAQTAFEKAMKKALQKDTYGIDETKYFGTATPSSETFYREDIVDLVNDITDSSGYFAVFALAGVELTTTGTLGQGEVDIADYNDDASDYYSIFTSDWIAYYQAELKADLSYIPKGLTYVEINRYFTNWLSEAQAVSASNSAKVIELEARYAALDAAAMDGQVIEAGKTLDTTAVTTYYAGSSWVAKQDAATDYLHSQIESKMQKIGPSDNVKTIVTNTNYNAILKQIEDIDEMFALGVSSTDDFNTDSKDPSHLESFDDWEDGLINGDGTGENGINYFKYDIPDAFYTAVEDIVNYAFTAPASWDDPVYEAGLADVMKDGADVFALLSDEIKTEDIFNNTSKKVSTVAYEIERYNKYLAIYKTLSDPIDAAAALCNAAVGTDEAATKAAADAYWALDTASQGAFNAGDYAVAKNTLKKAITDLLAASANAVNSEATKISTYKDMTEAFVTQYDTAVELEEYFDDGGDVGINLPTDSLLGLSTGKIEMYDANIVADVKKAIDDIVNPPASATSSDIVAVKAARAMFDGILTYTAVIALMAEGYDRQLVKYEAAVAQWDVEKAKIELSVDSIVLGGENPAVVVKDSTGKELVAGTDYEVVITGADKAGKATVTVTGKGNYAGTATSTFIVKPTKEKINSVKGAKKKFTVKYSSKKGEGATGAQIAYKKGNGKWKYKNTSNASKLTIKKLKKGNYKVKVRAIVKVDGTRYFGAYSATKKVKVK